MYIASTSCRTYKLINFSSLYSTNFRIYSGAGALVLFSSVSSPTKELNLLKNEAVEGWFLDMTALAVGLWISLYFAR